MNLIQILKSIISEAKDLPSGGDCFDASYDYTMKNGRNDKSLRLVHGFVSGQKKLSGYRFAHAWCEEDDMVIDVSNGRNIKLPKQLYYAIGEINPKECKYYSYRDVLSKSSEYGHKGPWDIENDFYSK